jgi:hypothetical protein
VYLAKGCGEAYNDKVLLGKFHEMSEEEQTRSGIETHRGKALKKTFARIDQIISSEKVN